MAIKLNGEYALPPEDEAPLRRSTLKGVGAAVVVAAMVLFIAAVGGETLGPALSLARDVLGAIAILLVVHQYSKSVANQRMILAREYHRRNKPELVLAALLPFAQGGLFMNRSRFDSTGEAHYLLAWAAKRCGEAELLTYSKEFLVRMRRGPWAKKALKL
jgi:hypothetical protein